MTDTSNYPDSLFLPPEAFEGPNKYMNIYGKPHVCVGDDFVEYIRADVSTKIKALKWYDKPEGQEMRIGRCGQTSYAVSFQLGRWGYNRRGGAGHTVSRMGGTMFVDEKDAMNGADEDHEIRIRECLE